MSHRKPLPDHLMLAHDLLDKQVADRAGEPLGRVDGLVLVEEAPGIWRLDRIEMGVPVLARRLAWVWRLPWLRRMRPMRFGFGRVTEVAMEITLNTTAKRARTLRFERWLADRVVQYIPRLKRSKGAK